MIQIYGADAEAFLQGVCTCDVTQLSSKKMVFSACCNRKGRIVANFWIWRDGEDFYVMLPASMSNILLTHLKKYLLRSKVNFNTELSDTTLSSSRGLIPSGARATGSRKNHTNLPFQPIWILPETTEQFTPQMINLQKHGGVSFTKGCYLGQEIIARTEHLGKLKRHLYKIQCENNKVNIADEIQNKKGEKVGVVVAITDNDMFAVIEDRAINEILQLKNANVTVNKHSDETS